MIEIDSVAKQPFGKNSLVSCPNKGTQLEHRASSLQKGCKDKETIRLSSLQESLKHEARSRVN